MMNKEQFKELQKACDARLMSFIGEWSFIEGLEIGQSFNVPANCIAPDTLGEWDDAKVDASMTDSSIEVHIGYGEILTVADGHNRLKTILAENEAQMIKVIFVGKR